jgi:predicted transcriptional regulator
MSSTLLERYDDRIAGVLSCYDRVMVTGTLPTVCYADGMTKFLHARQVRIFDYPKFAEPLRERVRERAALLAAEAGITIEHIAKSHTRKETTVAKVLAQRGEHPGLVHVISAMEGCDTYKPWHDKRTHKTYLRPDSGKCLHYYFYFMDAELGLIHLRVPTWAPFRLQFYCNGHSRLARQLTAERISFTAADNAFTRIADWQRAQDLADGFSPDQLHRVLDRYAAQCCPVLDVFAQTYHWSLMQVEYATDLVFRSAGTLGPLYEQLTRESVLSVKAEQIATFLGRKITPQLGQEVGSQFSTRIEGTCIKHHFGKASIKMYDKFGCVLRIETTTNDVSFFKHHRKVEHRDGPPTRGLASVKKTIYSLIDLREIMFGCNRRYLEHLSALDDFSAGVRALDRVTKPRVVGDKTVKGVNFFEPGDSALLHALQNPRVNICGIRRGDLLPELGMFSPTRLSRQLRRLLDLGVVKRIKGTYRYYLTKAGRAATAAAERLTAAVIIPAMI